MVRPFLNAYPKVDDSNFIAPSAEVIGDVTLGRGASVWFVDKIGRYAANYLRYSALYRGEDVPETNPFYERP